MVEKAKEEVAETIKSEGERATLETGVIGLNPELIKLIRKIKIQNKLWTKCIKSLNRGIKSCKNYGRRIRT